MVHALEAARCVKRVSAAAVKFPYRQHVWPPFANAGCDKNKRRCPRYPPPVHCSSLIFAAPITRKCQGPPGLSTWRANSNRERFGFTTSRLPPVREVLLA